MQSEVKSKRPTPKIWAALTPESQLTSCKHDAQAAGSHCLMMFEEPHTSPGFRLVRGASVRGTSVHLLLTKPLSSEFWTLNNVVAEGAVSITSTGRRAMQASHLGDKHTFDMNWTELKGLFKRERGENSVSFVAVLLSSKTLRTVTSSVNDTLSSRETTTSSETRLAGLPRGAREKEAEVLRVEIVLRRETMATQDTAAGQVAACS
ncbi:hypothetical protein BIW11_04020 [Tropilaelaps mercedesae]|uniref:Uncharacterized protein n=1 Tax=Tropilaelaps mercedesae TaxID=418985 RepID=A0A1V9XCW2_9ACAR|nr:hypothetical protein BIW11_04020 [Tropilaelaps mercedesae]